MTDTHMAREQAAVALAEAGAADLGARLVLVAAVDGLLASNDSRMRTWLRVARVAYAGTQKRLEQARREERAAWAGDLGARRRPVARAVLAVTA